MNNSNIYIKYRNFIFCIHNLYVHLVEVLVVVVIYIYIYIYILYLCVYIINGKDTIYI